MHPEILWTWEQLCQVFASAKQSSADKSLAITGISIDSRTAQPGDLFIALSSNPGPRFGGTPETPKDARDGHDFLEVAIKAGARALMVDREVESNAPLLRVADTLDGLWQLAQVARARNQGRVIVITGSSGKTTLRLWLESLLTTGCMTPIATAHTKRRKVHAARDSLNNHWGLPISLCRMPASADYSLFEIGTNHPGEVQPLAELVTPHLALVLNLLPAHLGNFANMEALKEEKLSISKGLSSGGTLILPWELAREVATKASHKDYQIITFGTDPGADVQGVMRDIQTAALDSGALIRANVMGQEVEVEIPFTGSHRLESVLALLAILAVLEINLAELLPAFRSLELPLGRGRRIQLGDITLIDDSYNANPVSMQLAIDALQDSTRPGRKIALLGEMLELGAAGEASHIEIGKQCGGMDLVLTFGDSFKNVAAGPAHQAHYDRVDDFDLTAFIASLQPGDQILVKGSNRVFWKNNFAVALREGLESR